jgi:hypothetical protein
MPLTQASPAMPPPPPAAPTPIALQGGATGGQAVAPAARTISRPLTREEMSAIRSARGELSNQLTSAEERRSRLVEELRGTEGQVRAGLEQRIGVLDERIVQLERDIATTGRQLSDARALVGTTEPARSVSQSFRMDEDVVFGVGSLLMFVFLAPVALAWMRMWWRKPARASHSAADTDSTARLERIEQAVDAIAIEVERVSEAQRYQARLLSEGQGAPAFVQPARAPEAVRIDG